MKNLLKISALTLAASISVGCATTASVEQATEEARKAQATANEALDTANQAKSLASDANARSMALEERMNRMFKRSMYK